MGGGVSKDGLGEFEHLVLLAVARLKDDAYGVPIVDELRARTGRQVSRASVYVALKRLEEKGLIDSSLGEPTPERGGRAKRYFRVNGEAVKRLRQARAELMRMWDDLPIVERG